MVAALSLRVYTGTNAATESGAVTGIDMVSADNATNSLANRQANPVGVGTNAFEKWMKLKVDTPPSNEVTNFQAWGDGAAPGADVDLMVTGDQVTGVTPVATASVIADSDWTQYTAGNKLQWDAGSYSATDETTDYLVMQLQVGAGASAGSLTQMVANFSYDEN